MESQHSVLSCLRVRQGDALPTTSFNLIQETAVRKLDVSRHIGTKITEVCAYADGIAIISRNKRGLEENLLTLDSEADNRGLRINEANTKYMELRRNVRHIYQLEIIDLNVSNNFLT